MLLVELTPEKRSTSVSIDQEVKIVLSSDYPFDLRDSKTNIIFKINEIEISEQYLYLNLSLDKKTLTIVFYPKERIQYKPNLKYGSIDAMYGKLDDMSESILEYGASYLVEYKVTQLSETGVLDEFADRFVFATEDGVFTNPYPENYFYSDHTQGLANYLPEWSKARYDKFSNFQQLLNPIGTHLEDMDDFILKQKNNSFLQTVNLNELATLFKVELDKNFQFSSIENEDGTISYIQPEITGTANLTKIDLLTSEQNDLINLFYNKEPTRISSVKEKVLSNLIFNGSNPTETKIEVNKELEREGGIALFFDKVQYSIYQNELQRIKIVKCRIYGESIFNTMQEEDFLLYNQRYVLSKKMWKRINTIEFFNIENQNINFKIFHFKDSEMFKDIPFLDSKIKTTFENNLEPILWSLEQRSKTPNNIQKRSILKKQITEGNTYAEILKSAGKTNSIQEFVLLDIKKSSNDISREVEVFDIASDFYSNNIYGIDNDFLYVYDKREPYSKRLKEINGSNGNADFIIELDTDELSFDENGEKEIIFKCVHSIPGKKIVRYRIKIKQPDGVVKYLKEDSSIVDNLIDATILANQTGMVLSEKQYSFAANLIGEYIIELETIYSGGSKSSHSVLIAIPGIYAKAKYKLKKILGTDKPLNIFFDYDQKLKIYTNSNVLHTLKLHKDGVLIDYENKVFYFCEDYSVIDIAPNLDNFETQSTSILPEYTLVKIQITPGITNIIYGNESQLLAQGVYSNGFNTIEKDITNNVKWFSSNSEIIQINPSTGKIKAVGVGTPVVTAEFEGFSHNAVVYAVPLLIAINVTSGSIYLPIGKTMNFVATGLYNNNTTRVLNSSELIWTSSDDAIGTVNSAGVVTSLDIGSITITATSIDGTIVGSKTIACSPPIVEEIEIEWEEDLR